MNVIVNIPIDYKICKRRYEGCINIGPKSSFNQSYCHNCTTKYYQQYYKEHREIMNKASARSKVKRNREKLEKMTEMVDV